MGVNSPAIRSIRTLDVVLAPATRDGGFDMRAFHRTDRGTCLTLIECKRYERKKKRVTADVVRGLYGITESEKP